MDLWAKDSSKGIVIPIGVDEEKENVNLTLDCGTGVHYAIVGGVGTGKTTIMNNIIMNAVADYSPNDINFTLVEFRRRESLDLYGGYYGLHHIKNLISTESVYDVIKEIKSAYECVNDRYELFKEGNGVRPLKTIDEWNTYWKSNLTESSDSMNDDRVLPRKVLLIDEFGEFYASLSLKEMDEVQRMLNCIIKLGRVAGVHLIFISHSYNAIGDSMWFESGFHKIILRSSDEVLKSIGLKPEDFYLKERYGEAYFVKYNEIKKFHVNFIHPDYIKDSIYEIHSHGIDNGFNYKRSVKVVNA